MTALHRFIWEHREDDPAQLALSAKKYPEVPIAYVARQVEALGKLRRKIPSWYQPGLDFPLPISLEQASSEATARFKASLVSGTTMADLTGGLGVDASFFAAQFDEVYYVEKIPEILAAAKHNLGVLGFKNIDFYPGEAEKFLGEQDREFDLLYLDPARRDDQKGKVFQIADCSPNVLEIKHLLLSRSSKILVKTAPLLDIQQAIRQLEYVVKVWVVEYEGECREVLYLLENTAPAMEDVPICAVSLNKSGAAEHLFEFTFGAERQTESTFSPALGYLYEPYAGVLKAGAFKSFAKQFGINKLHPNTHLYTAEKLVPQLPARSFRIVAVCKYDRKAVEPFIPERKANVSVRNFPDNTDQVRKKLGLRDGGDVYVFAATDCAEKRVIMVCAKV